MTKHKKKAASPRANNFKPIAFTVSGACIIFLVVCGGLRIMYADELDALDTFKASLRTGQATEAIESYSLVASSEDSFVRVLRDGAINGNSRRVLALAEKCAEREDYSTAIQLVSLIPDRSKLRRSRDVYLETWKVDNDNWAYEQAQSFAARERFGDAITLMARIFDRATYGPYQTELKTWHEAQLLRDKSAFSESIKKLASLPNTPRKKKWLSKLRIQKHAKEIADRKAAAEAAAKKFIDDEIESEKSRVVELITQEYQSGFGYYLDDNGNRRPLNRGLQGNRCTFTNYTRHLIVTIKEEDLQNFEIQPPGYAQFIRLKPEFLNFRWLGHATISPGESTTCQWEFPELMAGTWRVGAIRYHIEGVIRDVPPLSEYD